MLIETTSRTGGRYYLISFDADGNERTDDPDGLMSLGLGELLRTGTFTDVFIFSHGWQGDLPAARGQYGKWIEVMDDCSADVSHIRGVYPGYCPLIVGLHWPSLPWGEEEFGATELSFGGMPILCREDLVETYASRLADTPVAREALDVITNAAMVDIMPDNLPAEVRDAYLKLNREACLGNDGEGACPGADREPFDADRIYDAAQESLCFGVANLGGILAPLRALSFWKMKDRARSFGEGGAFRLLQELQACGGSHVRFHLMGHSFGCIVASAALAGPRGSDTVHLEPVHSLVLVQGALSLWSYCSSIPAASGRPGYFRPIIDEHRVKGPIITTSSARDTAVGRFYPLGAGARCDVVFAPGLLPKYGAVGAYGVRGPGLKIVDLDMGSVDCCYQFEQETIYNLESTAWIAHGGGLSGAHSDIAHPEVAHAVWAAVRDGAD